MCVCVCARDRWQRSRKYPRSPGAMPSQQGCVCSTALQGSGPTPRSWTTSCSGWDCWPACDPRRPGPPLEWWSLRHTTQRSGFAVPPEALQQGSSWLSVETREKTTCGPSMWSGFNWLFGGGVGLQLGIFCTSQGNFFLLLLHLTEGSEQEQMDGVF